MYAVTINALDTRAQQRSYARLERLAGLAARNPRRAQQLIERRDAKVPLFIQGGIHGNEYEGVDASMRFIERLATTPYGTDPDVDEVLDHAVVVYNPIQNPDGRVAGTRTNGNGFDLNRDYITQSQPEAEPSVSLISACPSPRCSTCTATSRQRWWRRRPCPTTRGSSTTSGRSGTSPASTPTRRGSRARASASAGR